MCHEPSARPPSPPLPPIAGGAGIAGTDHAVLVAADGARFRAFSALTAEPNAPGMVILPDVRGLHPFYEDLAVRFAEAGVHATAMDYFGRTAGVEGRDESFEFMPHVQRTRPETVAQDVAATMAHLRSSRGGGAGSVFTVGFCFGGRNSFNQAAEGHGVDGVIGFYGRVAPGDAADTNAPILRAGGYACPVLGLFGGADGSITAEDVASFRATLEDAGVEHRIVTYPGAPHSFFDRSFEEHREACDDAWRTMLEFIERHAGPGGA